MTQNTHKHASTRTHKQNYRYRHVYVRIHTHKQNILKIICELAGTHTAAFSGYDVTPEASGLSVPH